MFEVLFLKDYSRGYAKTSIAKWKILGNLFKSCKMPVKTGQGVKGSGFLEAFKHSNVLFYYLSFYALNGWIHWDDWIKWVPLIYKALKKIMDLRFLTINSSSTETTVRHWLKDSPRFINYLLIKLMYRIFFLNFRDILVFLGCFIIFHRIPWPSTDISVISDFSGLFVSKL